MKKNRRKTGIIGHFEDQRIDPRYSPGVDYGATAKILLVHKSWKILWRKGHPYWQGLYMGPAYAPARLEVRDDGDRLLFHMGRDLIQGGRLTIARLAAVLPEIRKVIDLPGLRKEHLDLKKTFVVDRA